MWTGAVSVPEPRWLVYILSDSTSPPGQDLVHVGVHPALTDRDVPAVLDSAWLASGEDFRETHPDAYSRVQELFDRGEPPMVTVISDHGTWGEEAVELGDGLVEQVEGISLVGGPSFRGRPGFRYVGGTLDRVVFPRRGVLPDWANIMVYTVRETDPLWSVPEILHSPPVNVFSWLGSGLPRNTTGVFRIASDDYPAFLLAAAGPRLALHMIPAGFVLGLWEIRGLPGHDGEGADYQAVETPRTRALRASLVGTFVDAPSTTHRRWA